ncbi:MAG: hypothetical protein QOJ50_3138 [Cryptosporangiaceae bacterium]|nr:hypothetical protein [Cryptosporangiaceae bacterium]
MRTPFGVAMNYAPPMSKVDAQRALREARYAATPPSPGNRGAGPADRPAPPMAAELDSASDGTELCGHRSMGNKSCRRAAGHEEKSHRYK